MKRLRILRSGLLGAFLPLLLLFAARPARADFRSDFLAARKAYDAGNYAEAAALFGNLLSNGVVNVEVEYNLANALFKSGDLPGAVLHYRRAWYRAPRDPDIAANLRFALDAAGAVPPRPGAFGRIFETLSREEWALAGLIAWFAAALLLSLDLLLRPARHIPARLAAACAAFALFAAAGWWYWRGFERRPEWVVTAPGVTALYGPVEGSTAHFRVPVAALVRAVSDNGKGWLEILYDGKTGWVPEKDMQRVSP